MIFPWQKKIPPLGLDWGYQTWKWVRLKKGGEDRPRIDFADSLTLPPEEKDWLPLLRKYVLEKKLEGAPTAVAFQEEGLHIRSLELPRMPPADLKEAIRWQMRDIAEASLESYSIRYMVLSEKSLPDIVRLVLLAFAIPAETVQKKRALLERAGLRPFFLEPTPVAMAAALENICPSADVGWVGCADLGFHSAYFIVAGNGGLHFVRGLPGLANARLDDPECASKISIELQHALDAFFISHQQEKLEKIFLAGGGAQIPNLPGLVSQNIGIPAEILNPFQKIGGEIPNAFLYGPALAAAGVMP